MQIQIKDLNVHYIEEGAGLPVLMLHGYSVDHRLMHGCMEPVFRGLQGYRRIYPDLPGMGETPARPWIRNSDDMLDVVTHFVRKVLPEGPFLLCGESYGGYLARGLMRRMPERVAGFVLLCPAVVMPRHLRKVPEHVVAVKEPGIETRVPAADWPEFEKMQTVQTLGCWERYRDEILTGVAMADFPFLDALRENGFEFRSVPEEAGWRLDCPGVILMGRQDTSVGYEDAWPLLPHYPRASFLVMDQAGHNLQIEQPWLFESVLREWLSRVKQWENGGGHA